MLKGPYQNGFYLAIIGDGNEGEPIRIQDGYWYSIGCADPHSLDSILVWEELDTRVPNREQREAKAADERLRETNYRLWRERYYKRYGRYPGHRKWNE
jgi:hypothetical protein